MDRRRESRFVEEQSDQIGEPEPTTDSIASR
jgi:hypothetical protein